MARKKTPSVGDSAWTVEFGTSIDPAIMGHDAGTLTGLHDITFGADGEGQTFAVALDWSLLGPLGRLGVQVAPDFFAYRLLSITLSEVAPILPYLLLVLILIFRPKGLLGTREG